MTLIVITTKTFNVRHKKYTANKNALGMCSQVVRKIIAHYRKKSHRNSVAVFLDDLSTY